VPRRSYASLAGGKRGAVAAFEREHSYAASPTPVVITGSPHTPGWTLDELIERAGKLQLPISMGNEESALDGLRTTKRLMSLRDYAALLRAPRPDAAAAPAAAGAAGAAAAAGAVAGAGFTTYAKQLADLFEALPPRRSEASLL